MHRPAPPRHTGWLIAGLAAIPVVSVSSAALLGDIASGTDPGRVWLGLVALVAGVVGGLLVLRVGRSVRDGLATLAEALVRYCGAFVQAIVVGGHGFMPARAATAPVVAVVPSAVRRRGPPLVLR